MMMLNNILISNAILDVMTVISELALGERGIRIAEMGRSGERG
jgi:hypothetical protein